ncbi:MAG: class I SAM-dependent methyltransferase [Candidatus Aenigmarchaeota archaeon]|nr:class I SAM-dependent methyltransferase [Candidatus Aenigmarchaeota archaeon]
MKTLEHHLKESWDQTYRNHNYKELPWETANPDKELTRLVNEGKIAKCKVLDIGCGAGTNSIFLSRQGFDVIGVDISSTAVKIAKHRTKDVGAKAKFLVGNAYNLKFQKSVFDFIFDRGCFHHIPIEFRKIYVKQNHRLLTDNGKYYLHAFSDSNYWHQENLFSLKKIKAYFGKYFKILEEKEIVHTQPNGERVYLRSVFMQKI